MMRLRWAVLGALLVVAAVLWIEARDWRAPAEIPPDARGALFERLRLSRSIAVRKLALERADREQLVLEFGERIAGEVRLRERAEARFRQRPAELVVAGEVIPVQTSGDSPSLPVAVGGCTVSDPTIEGTCEWERIDVAGEPGLRVRWRAEATAQLDGVPLAITTGGWRTADEARWEVAPAERPREPWRRALWAGGIASGEGILPRIAASWHGRRFAVQLGAGAIREAAQCGDCPGGGVSPVVDASVGVRW